ncbi:calcitonin gene-related peptide type 1 receptor-like isoform X3 [Sipha flava]|uniref:Calcitonin gene-related peptide type 1 receptor-like isoform X3 n=1 Tax=Sipha flava TaxID=143950 RepID=A0A8B8G3R9_9HEMI|nr:calcitonin gene-related peptide type 1 receptor-like isoform X3 [Sipha flava]
MTDYQYGLSNIQDNHILQQIIAKRKKMCESLLDDPLMSDSDVWCPREFDGWSCVNRTKAGGVATFPCPYFILGFDSKRFGQKICLQDGTWFKHPDSNKTWSNYTTCVDLDDLKLRNQVNMIYKWGYTVSLAALAVSIFIFFYFRSLTCTRIQIHKNLFISLAMNNCLWLVWYEAVVDNLPVLMANGLACKLLHVLVQYFLVATYFWMFCEGLYLHTLLVVTFLTESKVMPFLHTIGWGIPAVLVSTYAGLRTITTGETIQLLLDTRIAVLLDTVGTGVRVDVGQPGVPDQHCQTAVGQTACQTDHHGQSETRGDQRTGAVIQPPKLQKEQQQRGQLRQGARVIQQDWQGGPGHAHPDPSPRTPVHRHALSTGARHAVGARLPGHFSGGRLMPGPVRGATVLFLQRRGAVRD